MSFTNTRRYLKLALDAAEMSVWDSHIYDGNVLNGDVRWVDNGAALLGYQAVPLQYTFREFLDSVIPEDRQALVNTMQDAVNSLGGYEVEYRVVWPDASMHWLAAKAQAFANPEGDSIHTLGIIRDITGRKEAELTVIQQKELAEVTLSSIGDGVITANANGETQYLNRVAEQLTGWTTDDARNLPVEEIFRLVDENNDQPMENPAVKCLRLGQPIGISSRSQLLSRSGHKIPVEDSSAPIRIEGGPIFGAVTVFHDVSHERKLRHELSWHASHDPLTGLINRREFEVHIADALSSAKNNRDCHALLFLDLDQFKIVNDTSGHSAGDILLKTLATMLQSHMRDSDVLARLGGDELGVLLLNCPLDHAFNLADELRQAIKDFRFVWDSHTFEIGVSIGLVAIDENSKAMSELLSAADQACYVAKERGRNRVHIYQETDAMVAKRHGETLWVSRLNEALRKDYFRLYTQPIVSLNGDTNHHSEILIRMRSNDGILVLPGAFIPAAERYDLISTIDRWVIDKVCRSMKEERDADGQGDVVRVARKNYSINLSGLSLNDDFLQDYIAEKFRQYDIDPGRICFEITETAVISNLPKAQTFISDVKKLGCRFALDDFGSGLSSFAYLKVLEVDYLKIDGAFVRDVATNKINHAMVTAINEVGHVMGIETIAEYVEDDDVLAAVQGIGVDYAQGYAVGALAPLVHAMQ